jgi:hypothetical protein
MHINYQLSSNHKLISYMIIMKLKLLLNKIQSVKVIDKNSLTKQEEENATK